MGKVNETSDPYDEITIRRMRQFASGLSEVDRRAYAAVEAYKFDRGGVTYVSRMLEISPETIKRGQRDLDSPERLPEKGRQRHAGAGRIGVCAEQPGIELAFDRLIENRIAGDPMNEEIKWTDFQPRTIVEELAKQGYAITENTVRVLLKKKDYRKRKPVKVIAIGTVDPVKRNEQFENIEELCEQFQSSGWPVLSVDTKKKEFLGGLYREGKLYSKNGEALKRFDHDFPHLAEGKVVPHGIYDLHNNSGFITIGTSAETPAFVAECLGLWWNYRGRFDYSESKRILLLMDSGGANASRSVQFKHEMLKLATKTGMAIRIAHYPPYSSKWNPIEHRLFPHVTRSLQGIYLDSPETVKRCISERATTKTGLHTRAYVLDKPFQTGLKNPNPLPNSFPFVRSPEIPEWNYTCYPENGHFLLN